MGGHFSRLNNKVVFLSGLSPFSCSCDGGKIKPTNIYIVKLFSPHESLGFASRGMLIKHQKQNYLHMLKYSTKIHNLHPA